MSSRGRIRLSLGLKKLISFNEFECDFITYINHLPSVFKQTNSSLRTSTISP